MSEEFQGFMGDMNMKTLKTLIIAAILVLPIMAGSRVKNAKISSEEQKNSHKIAKIAKMVAKLAPRIKESKKMNISRSIFNSSTKYGIDPKIMLAIIATESSFRSEVVSSSGDISVAQINVKVWEKEFLRLKLGSIDRKKLVNNDDYAIVQMTKILSVIKKRHSRDPQWFARYHSGTKKYKRVYKEKVQDRMRMIASI
jgi:hypothetical protein